MLEESQVMKRKARWILNIGTAKFEDAEPDS